MSKSTQPVVQLELNPRLCPTPEPVPFSRFPWGKVSHTVNMLKRRDAPSTSWQGPGREGLWFGRSKERLCRPDTDSNRTMEKWT